MANEMNGVDLGVMHQTIQENLKEQFPQFKLVEFYREESERRAPSALQLPALLLELTEFEVDNANNPGTEQLPLIARFEARVIDTFDQDRTKINIRVLATQLAYYIHKNRRFHALNNHAVGPASVDRIEADHFDPDLDRYQVWRVDFSMQISIGENIWSQQGITPIPLYSYVPLVGIPHKDKYKHIWEFGK